MSMAQKSNKQESIEKMTLSRGEEGEFGWKTRRA
jgi:hypothetical protein